MRFVSLCYLFVWLCLLACSIPVHAQIKKIYHNPKSIAREKQSKFIDSIKFIPLEVKEGMEFSINDNYSVEVTDKYYILNDYNNKRLLLYLKDGHFVKKINYDKLGANFYPEYQEKENKFTFFGNNNQYSLTPKDQVKIKLDWNNNRNRKYFKKYILDLNDADLSIKKDVPAKQDIIDLYHFYDDYFLQGDISTSPLYKDSLEHEIKLYKNNQLVKSFFPYNRINEPKFLYNPGSVSYSKTDSPYVVFITRPSCDTIYRMTKDSMSAAYQLVMPLENSLPRSFFTKPFKNITERDNFRQNNGWLFRQVFGFYETPGFIFYGVSYFTNYESYIYDKKTELTYKTKNIKADSSQYNMQLFADFSHMRKNDTFYKARKAADLVAFFEKNKTAAIPRELESFLKSKPAANSPIIVEFKLKN